jgi:phosphoglycerate dehydrogenase-like enzyme
MDILIFAPYFKDKFPYIHQLKPEARIHILSIKIAVRYQLLGYVARQYFPYFLYCRTKRLVQEKTYAFVDGKLLESPSQNITIFLCDFNMKNSLFRTLLSVLPNLKWVHCLATGVDHLICPELKRREIILTNSGNVQSGRVAEFVMSLILAEAKNLRAHRRLQDCRRWRSLPAMEVKGKTLGIIGLGGIGRSLSQKAQALGMNVVAVRKNPDRTPEAFPIFSTNHLDRLLRLSDFVALCVPLTTETLGLFGEKEFRIMRPTAFLINVGRGPLIQTGALTKALRKGWIAGAALDVTDEHPLPRFSPLYTLPGLILTHYSSSFGENADEENFMAFLKNLEHFVTGKPLQNVIDVQSGY